MHDKTVYHIVKQTIPATKDESSSRKAAMASADTAAISMRNGGSVADVWIVGDQPVDAVTMLDAQTAPFVRAKAGPLPSRAADEHVIVTVAIDVAHRQPWTAA